MRYKEAGVDIESGNRLVELIKPLAHTAMTTGVVTELGGFSGLFSPPWREFRDPLLVACTDGVGTKLKVAFMADRHDTVGIDLVAMSVNDLITVGALPLFFLDYFACGKLEVEKAYEVIKGVVQGCREAGCALLGGETAEMPSFYPLGEYDLAGFAVGMVDRREFLDGSSIEEGDRVLGLASSGLHSNGYSLARKVVFEVEGLSIYDTFPWGKGVVQELLEPTLIYVKPLRGLKEGGVTLKGLAHVTGGGLWENPKRILPPHVTMELDPRRWEIPPIFSYLQEKGDVPWGEMYRTFNMGLGMVMVVPSDEVAKALRILEVKGCKAWEVGEIVEGEREVKIWGVSHLR